MGSIAGQDWFFAANGFGPDATAIEVLNITGKTGGLNLVLSRALPDFQVANTELDICNQTLRLRDAAKSTLGSNSALYQWTSTGLAWAENDPVRVALFARPWPAPAAPVLVAPSGTTGMMRVSWQPPSDDIAIVGYNVRYRPVGQSGSFARASSSDREKVLRYLTPGTTYEAQVCTIVEWTTRAGGCSGWSRLAVAPRGPANANDVTLSLELPGGGSKATVAWNGTLTYRIRLSDVRDSSGLEFYTSMLGIAGIRLGPPGAPIPKFGPETSNTVSNFSYRGIARKFIVWDSPTSGYWERTQAVWTGAGPQSSHVLELIDKPARFFGIRMNRIGTPSSLCVEITDSSSNVTGPCAARQARGNPPTVTRTPAVSAAGRDRLWTDGETVEVTLGFSEAVAVNTANGVPSVGIGLGGSESRSATYESGSGSAKLVFGYTLVTDDGSHSSMAVAPDSLALNGGTIQSVATSVDAALAHNGAFVQGGAGRSSVRGVAGRGVQGPTARFGALPERHDGAAPFTVELHFSAEPEGLSYRTVQGGLLEATGGTVTGARRLTKGSNLGWEVTVEPDGAGDIALRLPARACGRPNAVCIGGRALARAADATVPGASVVVPRVDVRADNSAPRVMSIMRQTPSSSPTNASSLTWRVTFDVDVANVDVADFEVNGTTAAPTAVSEVTASTVYDVTATGGNLADLNATVTLAFAVGQDIADTASHALSNTTPTGANDNDYVVDNTKPTVTITGVPLTSTAAFTATLTFLEGVNGFVVGDIAVGNGTASAFTGSDGDMAFTALITPTADGAVTVDVAAGVATDAAGNDNTAATQVSSTVTAVLQPAGPHRARGGLAGDADGG